MTRRLNFLCVLSLLLLSSAVFAQEKGKLKMPDNYTSEDVAKDKKQAQEWKKGKVNFPSKPKDMWELGIHGGYFMVAGDVNPELGYAFGGHLRKSLGYSFAVRFNAMYGVAKGLNFQGGMVGPYLMGLYDKALLDEDRNPSYGRSLNGRSGSGLPFYHNFKIKYFEASTQGIFTLNNLKFHRERNLWDLFIIAGLGFNGYQNTMNAYDANGDPYDFRNVGEGLSRDIAADRRQIKDNVRNVLDDSYETNGPKWGNLFDLGGDDFDGSPRINAIANVGIGIGYHLSKRVTLTLEHQATFNDDDLLDGYRWAEQGDVTRDVDVPQYTHLRLNFHLGSFKKRVEPLWWLNPLDAPYEQIANNTRKSDPENLLRDEDGDGVPDFLDKEPNSPPDCPVDTRGVTLDSDSDGIPDCEDKEPYSPPGYPVDPNGVAQIPANPIGMTQPEVEALAREKGWGRSGPSGCNGDWFLPMIHFDLDKYYIRPRFYPELSYVATVMKNCPNLRIVVTGNTDVRLPSNYNQVLSFNRANNAINYLVTNHGISRSRLILRYAGEESPLIPNLPDNHINDSYEKARKQFMNRRVEFSVARGVESDMSRPQGPEAGSNTPRSSRNGRIYSGNPGSGY